MARIVYHDGRQYQNINDLKIAILLAWNQLSLDLLKQLVKSMPSRIFEVIRKNGGPTHY